MSSDEDYLFDEDDVDSGNESPENSDDDEEDWGMDIGLGMCKLYVYVENIDISNIEEFIFSNPYLYNFYF